MTPTLSLSPFALRHCILEDLIRLRGMDAPKPKEISLQAHYAAPSDPVLTELIEPNSVVLLVGRTDNHIFQEMRASLGKPAQVQQVLQAMSDAIREAPADALGAETPLRLARLTYHGHRVVDQLIVDPFLGFNLLAVNIQGGVPLQNGFKLWNLNQEDGQESLQGLLLLRPAVFTPMEEAAEALDLEDQTSIELSFQPLASILDDVKHVAKDIGNVGRQTAGYAEGGYKAAKQAGVFDDAEQAADNFGEYDAGRYQFIPQLGKEVDLNDQGKEYSVNELLEIRNALLRNAPSSKK